MVMQCKQCGKEELSLSELGLCNFCDYSIKRNMTILTESTDVMNKTKNIMTFTYRCRVALETLVRLKKFDHLNYIDPPASQLIADILEKRSATIFNYWEKHCNELSQKLESYKSIDKIVDTIEKTKEEFSKFEEYIQNQEWIESIKDLIKTLIDDHIIGWYNDLVIEAKEFEKNSNKKLAIKKLKEALKIFEKIENYFDDGNQRLGLELKEWIEGLEN